MLGLTCQGLRWAAAQACCCENVMSLGITTLGTIYSSSLFPGRAPDDNLLLLSYIGGAMNRGIVDQTPEQLADQVRHGFDDTPTCPYIDLCGCLERPVCQAVGVDVRIASRRPEVHGHAGGAMVFPSLMMDAQ
eukprot:scaffold62772_cov21-Tisochrysis_lutea.AAC.1